MYKYLICISVLLVLFSFWTYQGIAETRIHVDLSGDLNALSNLWIHKMVWLGPLSSANFPFSPIYYYLLFPGLLLSGGNGISVIVSNSFIALLALSIYAYFQLKKSLIPTLFVILTIGLSPWWMKTSSLLWNGHMYVPFIFLALTSLWFKTSLLIPALFFGISISMDFAAILALPILFYEWWVRVNRVKNFFRILLGLLLPWTPILIFEIITKGFLTRQWIQYPASAGLFFLPSTRNITSLINAIGIPEALAYVTILISALTALKRERYWIIFISSPLIFLMFVSPLKQYYLLGLVCALTFIIVTILSSKKIGALIFTAIILVYAQTINIPPLTFTGRSIPRLEKVVKAFIQKDLDLTKQYAVISIIDSKNSAPQADDYRFFLRMNGVNTLSIDDYPKADILLLFVEVPNFDFLHFEDWHTQWFGSRKFISAQNIDGIEIVMYGRD